jgi:hypothetical protein
MLNIERRLENEEVEIRKPHESRNAVSLVSCILALASESTLYLVLCTYYNEVLLLDTNYLPAAAGNIECRTLIGE